MHCADDAVQATYRPVHLANDAVQAACRAVHVDDEGLRVKWRYPYFGTRVRALNGVALAFISSSGLGGKPFHLRTAP